MIKQIVLDKKTVGEGQPCYIIAEIGSNHNKDLVTAKKLIDVAKDSGCDAVKFQSYTAEGLYSIYTPRSSEMEGRSPAGETPYELIKRIQMPISWHKELKEYCDLKGITFCSTPFDESMVDVLESIKTPFYKVASFEITYYPLLKKIAQTGKPVVLSTGNSRLDDVEIAVNFLKKNGCKQLALLHCVSQYPAQEQDINLRCMSTLAAAFGCVVGFSDHTTNALSSSLAIGLGASIIEKHITLDKTFFGPDHPFALEPHELKELVSVIRRAEIILGSGIKDVCLNEEENHKIGRRSIVAVRDIQAGEILSHDMVVIKRPGLGLHPKFMEIISGKKLLKGVKKDQWLVWSDFLI